MPRAKSNSDFTVNVTDHTFLVSDHSYFPCDQNFGFIEKQKAFLSNIFVPKNWIDVIIAARKEILLKSL